MKTATAIALLLVALLCVPSAQADRFGSGGGAFDIEFVLIRNGGNTADTTGNPNPAGSVAGSFRIGKFEISEDAINKANALGGLGITKDARGPDKPATSISWNEAARFVNWLNTSGGNPPAYKFAIQPGEAGYSANANIELWTIGDPGYNPNNLYRNSLARYFLPSAHEWYKAAYYEPASGVYYNYPTGSDTAPTPVASGTAAGTAVHSQPGAQGPADIMLAGGLSPYGTMGQGGNVYEWEETDFDMVNGPSSSARGFRGGLWFGAVSELHVSSRFNVGPTTQSNTIGFRVASLLDGDFNHDGFIDAADYVLWRKNDGSPEEYNAWRTNFGTAPTTGSALATAVPEPWIGSLIFTTVVCSNVLRLPRLRYQRTGAA